MSKPARLSATNPSELDLDVRLDLSGEALKAALAGLLAGGDRHGGIEQVVEALRLKGDVFKDTFADKGHNLTPDAFLKLCMFMPTVRRRVTDFTAGEGFETLKAALIELFEPIDVDKRLARFQSHFPSGRKYRWVRDLAAEVLHNTNMELYPLMTRWVWDEKSNSGVLREIWFGDDVDTMILAVPDSYGTFLKLREELSGYLTDNGMFRDVPHYVDLLCAQVYSGYISSQGGAFLKADFASEQDSFLFVLRLMGLDGVKAKTRAQDSLEADDDIDLGDIMTTSRLLGNA
ncbi:MAG: hypothetical protein H6918_10320 [Sphingomonadaceae bacterium]|nr:hypothetical protein [Sphingomonadaceae bacterium]